MPEHECNHVEEIRTVRSWKAQGLSDLIALQKRSHKWQLSIASVILASVFGLMGWIYMDAQETSADKARIETRLEAIERRVEKRESIEPQLARLEARMDALLVSLASIERRIERQEGISDGD